MSQEKPNTAKFPRGSTLENQFYKGEDGTLSVDKDRKELRLHDGETTGGFRVGLDEAPADGKKYQRKNGVWVAEDSNELTFTPSLPNYQLSINRAFVNLEGSGYIDDDGRLFVSGAFSRFTCYGYVEIMPDKRFTQVSADIWSEGFIALDTTGRIWTAGKGSYFQYGASGDEDNGDGNWPPVLLDHNPDWAWVHASEFYTTFAIKKDGTLWSLGDTTFGYLGRITNGDNQSTFGQVGTRNDYLSVDGLYWKGTAIAKNGDVERWGYNYEGYATGQGTEEDAEQPVVVANRKAGLDWYRQAIDGAYTSVIIGSDGRLYMAGVANVLVEGATKVTPQPTNDVETVDNLTWTPVSDDTDWAWLAGQGAWYGFLAVKHDGSMWAYDWFYNDEGDWVYYAEPTAILPGVHIVDIQTSFEQVYVALSKEGDVYCWGENWSGMVGDGRGSFEAGHTYFGTGQQDYVLSPTKVLSDVVWVFTNYWQTIAQKKDGTIWTWGQNWGGNAGVPYYVYQEIAIPYNTNQPFYRPPLPGPADLTKGDMTFGFFGMVTDDKLIDSSGLDNMLGLPGGRIYHTDLWAKIALNDKICFVPLHPILYRISRNDLSNHNLIDADDAAKKVIKTYDFTLRLMAGGAGNPHVEGGDVTGSEWDRIYSMLSENSTVPAEERWLSLTDTELGFDGGNGSWTWVREQVEDKSYLAVLRGGNGPFGVKTDHLNSDDNEYGWRPILEYVPTTEDRTRPYMVIN